MQSFYSIILSTLPLTTISYLFPLSAQAQVIPDGTTSTTVNQDGNNFLIESGDRVGDNLFHSFNEFSVPTLGSAVFNNAGDIANIFSRVTGSNISSIDGLLGANGAANLFLINPNGIIFGENASLNLGGSFFASTADSLLFEGDTEFSAVNPQAPPLLEVSIPIGASFRDNPGDITVRNSSISSNITSVSPTDNYFAFIGGNVTFDGANFLVPGLRVELGGLTEAGILDITENSSLRFPDAVDRGNVSVINSSLINVSGAGGGSININANNIELTSGSQFNVGIFAGLGSPDTQAGDVAINATNNVSINGENSSIFSTSGTNDLDSLGNIEITAQNIAFTNGGSIFSVINGQVNAGDITLNAQENISFDGNDGDSVTGILGLLSATGDGNFGSINLNAQNLFLNNGGQISTFATGFGQSANVNINAENVIIDGEDPNEGLQTSSIVSVADGVGNSGDISIVTDNLTLSNGGNIRADSNGIQGNSGNINITANQISIGGEGSLEGIVSGITTNVNTEIASNSSDIDITTDSLSLDNSGQIAAGIFSPGNAGDINIHATDSVIVDGKNGIFASGISVSAVTEDAGNAGNIKITAPSISLINGGDVRSSSGGTGNAGNLEFTTNNFVLDAGVINTSTSEQGDAGNITISVTDKFFATNQSLISSSVGNAVQDAAVGKVGNINITAKEITLDNRSQIQAGAFSGATAEATGIVSLTATKSITFTGKLTGIFSNNDSGSFGNASQAQLFAPTVTLQNGAAITSNNLGQGNGGVVTIEANNLNLENGTTISAGTVSGIGGIVTLDIAENLILRDNNLFPSENNLIEARARQDANGGNVNINAELVIAFPNQNNDIIANAERGNGGNIEIFTQAIFGLEERRATPPNQTNDIDASSKFGLQGDFSLNTPDFDPTTGLINLPASVGDASDQISQNPCQQGVGSQFIVTGKGGLPPTVNESLNSESARVGLIEPVEERLDDGETGGQGENTTTIPEAVPAQGWVFNEKGEVTLKAYSTSNNQIQRPQQNKQNACNSRITP